MPYIAIKLKISFLGNGDFSPVQQRRSLPIPGFESNNISLGLIAIEVPYSIYRKRSYAMPVTLVLVGSSLYRNRPLTRMIERRIEAKNRSIQSIHRIEASDTRLIDSLQTVLKLSPDLCIAASSEAYPLVSRILATLKHDALIATDDTLHPASATAVKKESFLLRMDQAWCNVLHIKEEEAIPEILLREGDPYTIWQLFGTEEHLKTLRQHARDNGYFFDYFQQIEGWYEIRIRSAYRLDRLIAPSSALLLFPSDNIFDSCIEIFSGRKETITFAESCTGGLIASSLTARSGSSDILKGSVVSYANEIKNRWLEVKESVLENPGAVSRECVEEMAAGARKLAGSDIALAVSGIAGPTGGTALKPVGTVYIAVADGEKIRSRHLLLKGDRNYIQYQSMMHVLKLMIWMKKDIFQNFFKIS